MQDILAVVAREYNMSVPTLLEKTRRPAVAHPRQVVMWIARTCTKRSLCDIAERIGGMDHTTIMYGVEQVSARMAANADYSIKVHSLAQQAMSRAALRDTPAKLISEREAAAA